MDWCLVTPIGCAVVVAVWHLYKGFQVWCILDEWRHEDAEGLRPSLSPLNQVRRAVRVLALDARIRELRAQDRHEDATLFVRRLAHEDPLAAGRHAVVLAHLGHERDRMFATVARALELYPAQDVLRAEGAKAMFEAGDTKRALALVDQAPQASLELDLVRAELLDDLGDTSAAEAAVQSLNTAHARLWGDEGRYDQDMVGQAKRLAARLGAAGRSEVVARTVATGTLQPHSATNHLWVGRVARDDAPDLLGVEYPLSDLEGQIAAGYAQLEGDPDDLDALCRVGMGALRTHQLDVALRSFERSVEIDPGWFPGQLGLGATLRAARDGEQARALRLPRAPAHPAWGALFPDFEALTDTERRLVSASVLPLENHAIRLAEAGERILILPLDARPADAPERGVVGCWIYDLAGDDVSAGTTWPIARVLARLVFGILDNADGLRVLELIEQANERPYDFGIGDLNEPALFFSECYAAWLDQTWSPDPLRPLPPGVVALFSRRGAPPLATSK